MPLLPPKYYLKMHTEFSSENLKGKDNFGGLRVEKMKILKWILKKYGHGPMAFSCKHGNGLSSLTDGGKFPH
jgi:hypothetical protein